MSYQQVTNNLFEIHQVLSCNYLEGVLFKVRLWLHCYQNAQNLFQNYYLQYFKLFKDCCQEENMIDAGIIKFLINDIIATEEYTLEGVANYVRVPVDIIVDLVAGINLNPSLSLSSKIMELHTLVRKPIYNELMKKILNKVPD